jgi:hypothetical protein
MNHDLMRVLEVAVPEPPRALDPGTVLHAARRRRRIRASLTVVAAAALVGLAVTGSLITGGPWVHRSTVQVADPPLTISALAQRTPIGATVAKALPGIDLAHPGQGTLVATVGPEKVYLLEATDGSLCTVVDEGFGSSWGGCGPRSELLTTGVISSTVPSYPPYNDGRTKVIVVVPDGYRTATLGNKTVQVSRNVALLSGPFSVRSLTIDGPSVRAVTFNLATYLHQPAS